MTRVLVLIADGRLRAKAPDDTYWPIHAQHLILPPASVRLLLELDPLGLAGTATFVLEGDRLYADLTPMRAVPRGLYPAVAYMAHWRDRALGLIAIGDVGLCRAPNADPRILPVPVVR